ncbi:MAG: DNA starvation/stationary phase protection protein, partial [Methanomicrobia archaeon]|nr:DNA starvation/stationary phase protection protein [Methanomicrobia archaeon]
MNKLHTLLDLQVANFSVLFTKLHHFHWFVEGPQFFALHAKFEELYD